MAEEQDNLNYDNVLLELQRIERLEQNHDEIQSQIEEIKEVQDELKENAKFVSETIGIEENDKKKNVIDGGKLSSTLTTSEKKRYENIGKEFIAGAGKEFENIRKASKFKEMMSTVKRKFTMGVIEFKENLKKIKQKSGFLGKLLIIIGLLGTIVTLFKEKITSVLPNVTDKISDIFSSVKECIGNIITNIFEYVTQGIGTSFTNIMSEVVTQVIPNFIGTFFQMTLPNAVVNLYLGILSAFSDDAQNMFEERMNQQIEKTTDDTAERADQELQTEAKEEDYYTGIINSVWKTQQAFEADKENAAMSDMIAIRRDSGVSAMVRDTESSQVLSYLDSIVEGDQDFRNLIDRGQFNPTSFLEQIKKANEDKQLTQKEIYDAMRDSVDQSILESGFEMAQGIRGEAIFQFGDALNRMIAQSDKTKKEMDTRIAARRAQEDEQKNLANEYKKTITEINAKDAIAGTLATSFTNLVAKIIEFMNGDKLKNMIVDALTATNDRFKEFFEQFGSYVNSLISKIEDVIVTINQLKQNSQDELKLLAGAIQKTLGNGRLSRDIIANMQNVSSVMNAVVNIDLSQKGANPTIATIVQEVISIDERLSFLMRTANNNLQAVVTGLKNIQNLHTNSKEHTQKLVKETCSSIIKDTQLANAIDIENNKKKIASIENIIKKPVLQPIATGSTAPCLDVS